MNDLQIIYQILIDEIYKGDQLIFELTLNKIEDQKLKLGLLFELYVKSGYESNKKDIINMVRLQSIEDILINPDLIIEYRNYFVQTFSPFLKKDVEEKPSPKELQSCIDFINLVEKCGDCVVWNENPQIVEGAKSLTHKAQRYLRELLIEKEQYEEVVYLDKCLA